VGTNISRQEHVHGTLALVTQTLTPTARFSWGWGTITTEACVLNLVTAPLFQTH
jgi:hypothetical protein